jgi:hypothetical protein
VVAFTIAASAIGAAGQAPTFAESVVKTIADNSLAAKPAASAALSRIATAATSAENFRLLGFETTEEAKSATLGEPILVYDVPLNKLQGFSPSEPSGSLLAGGNRLLYPVQLNQQVRSSVTVANVNGEWTPVSSGRPVFAASIFGLRTSDAAKAGVPVTSYIEVSIPALNLEFLGRVSGKNLYLIPIRDYQGLGLSAGQAYPEVELFARLAAVARMGNNGPSN